MVMEVLLAFSIFVIFTTTIFSLKFSMQRLKIWSINELDKMKTLVSDFDSNSYASSTAYGNNTIVYSNELFRISKSNYVDAWGRDTCYQRLVLDNSKITEYSFGLNIGSGNYSTDLEARNGMVYMTSDSSGASAHDFYVIDNTNPQSPIKISSINTGPGIEAIDVAGPYAFIAQRSTANQLQIIDIHSRSEPRLVSQLKLNLPTPTTTPPFATSIFYYRGYVYLGTTKWNGAEFSVIDVSDVKFPKVVGEFETGTQINDIYVDQETAYLATSDEMQMRILDVSEKSKPVLKDIFTSSGWQTQEGKVIDSFEGKLSLGRTVGGFNNVNNHELFIFGTTTISKDIPGGVYSVLKRPSNIFILTRSHGKELQVYDTNIQSKIFEYGLGSSPVRMTCDGSGLYFATGDSAGFKFIDLNAKK